MVSVNNNYLLSVAKVVHPVLNASTKAKNNMLFT